MGKNIVMVYTCTALIIREINTCNVPTYEEFNVIIFYGHVKQNQDFRHLAGRFIYNSSSAMTIHHD